MDELTAGGPRGSSPEDRLRTLNDQGSRPGQYVLYWMIAARRTRYSFALDRALRLCRELNRPLVVLEALRVGHRYAADRHHQFVFDGIADNRKALEAAGVRSLTYVEREDDEGKGLLAALAAEAAVVVTDDFPSYFLPRMLNAAARLPVRIEAVDGNGVLPLGSVERDFTTAASFRRHLQKVLVPHLVAGPEPDPLRGYDLGRAEVSDDIVRRWHLDAPLPALAELPIDHAVRPVGTGGPRHAQALWKRFSSQALSRYPDDRNHPDKAAASGLSPYLHYGHIGSFEILDDLLADWDPGDVGKVTGSREGWWGLDPAREAFLDQLITWRELGYVACSRDAMGYDQLPDWARLTLNHHRSDVREELYSLDDLEAAATDDPIWNAAQRQLVREGVIHNYLRMLWGKKVLQWTDTPEEAFERLEYLNDRFALDGRNPNSYSGISWVFGRFDRAWGPERPIFGKVRYMTSESTRRKLRLSEYLERYGA